MPHWAVAGAVAVTAVQPVPLGCWADLPPKRLLGRLHMDASAERWCVLSIILTNCLVERVSFLQKNLFLARVLRPPRRWAVCAARS